MSKMKFLLKNLLKTKYEITKIKIPSIPFRVNALYIIPNDFCFYHCPIFLVIKSFSKGSSFLDAPCFSPFRKLKTYFRKLTKKTFKFGSTFEY